MVRRRGTAVDAVRLTAVAFALAVTVSVAVAGAATVASADAARTTMQVDASNDRVSVSETTTVQVVVRNVDGGVGAYELAVDLSDASVATISDVELVGDPGLRTVEVASNGSRADLKAALLDTEDTGDVTVASVTLSGVASGTTDVSVSVSALGAEDGSRYRVDDGSTSVTVAEEADETATSADAVAPDGDATAVDSGGGTAGDSRATPVTEATDRGDDAAASGGDAADDSADSVPDAPVPFDADDVPAWAVGAALALVALALFAVRRVR